MRCKKDGVPLSSCQKPICKCEIRMELIKSKAAGVMTDRFIEMAEKTARLWYEQRSTAGWRYALDDVISLFRIKLVSNWHKIDEDRHIFGFLQTMVRRCGIDHERKMTGKNWRHEKAEKEELLRKQKEMDDARD